MTRSAVHLLLFIGLAPVSLFAGNGVSAPSESVPSPHAPYVMPAGFVSGVDYNANTVIIKLKPEYQTLFATADHLPVPFKQLMNQIGTRSFAKKFPHKSPLTTRKNALGQQLVDLSLVYELTYSAELPVEKVVNRILQMGFAEYAEPHLIPHLDYTPNDGLLSNQTYLNSMHVPEGWDIDKGDTSVVIGITDTGTDTDHPDLMNNIAYNTADPINGTDDDNDGYVDNYRGWDVGMNDNDPQWEALTHGVAVSGLAAASTDNSEGIASPAFKCRFLPVKIADNTGSLVGAYEGIVYAADHGCQIINCSWGSSGYSAYNEDIVNYAAINKNALVVAAAGNTNKDEAHYPGSYKNALNVAGYNNDGRKGSYSTYGYTVDIGAPGTSSYSTIDGGAYGSIGNGTSYASPLTAGCAAVVKSHFPSYTGLQVGERLRITADLVDTVTGNATYTEKLGAGMVNLYRALTDPDAPSVVMSDENIDDHGDNIFVVDDTLWISATFTNYLAPTSNLTATLSSPSSYVTITDNQTLLGALGTLASTDNSGDPWTVVIDSGTPQNTVITFVVDITDGSYSSKAYFKLTVNVDYINVTINEVKTTVTSKGRTGYNLPNQVEGLGFVYKDSSLMYEGGLMLGISSGPEVSDNMRGATAGNTDEDFASVIPVYQVIPSLKSDFDLAGEFNDAPASVPLNAHVKHKSFAWTEAGHTKYIILQYTIINEGSTAWSDLHAGIFSDWDIMDYSQNRVATDAAHKLGYAYSTQASGIYAGIRLLTGGPFLHYAIDNDGTGGGVNIYDGFPSSEKYTTLSTNRDTAGMRDIASVVSSGPFNVAPNDSVVVAFALIAGDDLTDIITSSDHAQDKYDWLVGLPTQNPWSLQFGDIFPNPGKDQIGIRFELETATTLSFEVYSVSGQKITKTKPVKYAAGAHQETLSVAQLAAGTYVLAVRNDKMVSSRSFILRK
ncbi:MAG: S8 family peptidase [Flavobacteriales bacterium]|nr:S8 family peptidase [Flavobacteriales bacterium]MCB9447598.1 S8 family peptidase [Flavobacteriales bacterium]